MYYADVEFCMVYMDDSMVETGETILTWMLCKKLGVQFEIVSYDRNL